MKVPPARYLVAAAMMLVPSAALAQPGAPASPVPGPPIAPGVCVVVDLARDTLSPQERSAVQTLALQSFEARGIATDATGTSCTELYTISNVRLGDTVTALISGPRGSRTGRVSKLDDLPNLYSQLVTALVTGAPMATGGDAVDRTNVTRDQAAPRRAQADHLKYVQLGYGSVLSPARSAGPAFGFGYRRELDRIALDASLALLLANDRDKSDGVTMHLIKLLAMRYQDPIADSTLYYGGGISYGFTASYAGGTGYTGSGMQGHLIVGDEAFRSSTIRGFFQVDVTLPFYAVTASTDSGSRYAPSMMATFGIGWGRSNVVRVVQD